MTPTYQKVCSIGCLIIIPQLTSQTHVPRPDPAAPDAGGGRGGREPPLQGRGRGRAQAGARRAQSDAVPRLPGAGRGRGEGLHPAAGLHHRAGKFINEISLVNKILG